MNGGGAIGGTGLGFSDEQIHDIKVGTDNNYYFIATINGNSNTQLNGQPQTVYNVPNGGEDIFLFSTTCDGQVRWSQAIGGGGLFDRAYNLVLDSSNNVYVGVNLSFGENNLPVHFSPTETLGGPPANNTTNSDFYKTTFLVKYDSNGNYITRKALQGNVNGFNWSSQISDLMIDSQNKIHFIVGLINGTHLDNNVTVPSSFNTLYSFQFHLAVYDTNLNYESSMELPLGTYLPQKTRLAYDEVLNQYYIAGERDLSMQLVYDNDAIVNRSFIIAFNGINSTTGVDGEEIWRREIYSQPTGQLADNRFTSLKINSNSDVYVGGNLFIDPAEQNIKIYDPTDTNVQPYLFTPGADWTIPLIVKFNSDSNVQWAQATAAYSSGVLGPAPRRAKGIALTGNEVAFGVQSGGDFWDTIEIVRPIINYQPDPVLIRFNQQTGAVLNAHDIQGEAVSSKQMTAVSTDKDGNYITAGTFNANLFMNNTLGITPLVSTGEADFFVAKLAATPCGSGASTNKFNNITVNVYPNPTSDIVNIETAEKLAATYKVFNESAQQIYGKGQKINDGMYQINLEGMASGIYFILLKSETGKTETIKVVKK